MSASRRDQPVRSRRSRSKESVVGPSPPTTTTTASHGYRSMMLRPAALGLAKLMLLPLASAAPLGLWSRGLGVLKEQEDLPKDADDPNLWVYLGVAVVLVLLGGAFAGLTIALMGQDETYLQVIATSGEGAERKNAKKVLALLNKGKHWVLVTLLLSNVITNETLPIVLDRSLGGGWPAVVSSTVLIVIFGEIVPQSVCVRYGLSIGAFMAPFVLVLMWLLCIVAWPTAKLLDYLLGKDHGTMYNKPGLKTLVQLHKSLGTTPGDRLMEDEVTIINSVLDLKEKPVGAIMTPMGDVFTMSADTVLDESMMDTVLSEGYSRIPIHAPDNPRNFIGMLLVKILITYDPEDCKRVRDFALATLPETLPNTSCLDIINFFQEGKSHMVLVSDFPGQDKGALGVVTLEDVIEELIGEEIIDESDVFVDVHKAIRRIAPAPRTRYNKGAGAVESDTEGKELGEEAPLLGREERGREELVRKHSGPNGQGTTFLMRRKSSTASESARDPTRPAPLPVRGNATELRHQLMHLGPSNQASKPRATKYTSVKIKPGVGTIPEGQATTNGDSHLTGDSLDSVNAGPDGGEGAGLLKNAGMDAKDGASAVSAGYGTMPDHNARSLRPSPKRDDGTEYTDGRSDVSPGGDGENEATSRTGPMLSRVNNKLVVGSAKVEDGDNEDGDGDGDDDGDTLGEMAAPARDRSKSRRTARSGSITETTVDLNGMQKVVLETTSSSEELAGEDGAAGDGQKGDGKVSPQESNEGDSKDSKKRRKRRSKKDKNGGSS